MLMSYIGLQSEHPDLRAPRLRVTDLPAHALRPDVLRLPPIRRRGRSSSTPTPVQRPRRSERVRALPSEPDGQVVRMVRHGSEGGRGVWIGERGICRYGEERWHGREVTGKMECLVAPPVSL